MWKKRMAYGLIVSLIVSMTAGNAWAAGWIRSETPLNKPGLSSGWWYSLNPENTIWYAAGESQEVVWYWIDGNGDGTAECYAFDQTGWMYSDTTTPDGYMVNKDGAWIVDGIVQTRNSLTEITVSKGSGGGGSSGSGGSGGGSGSGGSDGNSGGGITQPDESENQLSYKVQCVNEEDGTILKSVFGIGKKGENISLGNYPIKGYELSSGQPISVLLQMDGEIFTVYYHSKEDTESPPDTKEMFSYTINYRDIDSMSVLSVQTGKAEKDSVVVISHPDIAGYKICTDQRNEFKLTADKTVQNIYYQSLTDATPSDAQKVSWAVHFVNQEDHSKKLWPSQSGTITDEGILMINFPETIYEEDGTIWESVEIPPIERQIFGPGKHIEYVEFVATGNIPEIPDPEEDDKKLLENYLQTAKRYEAEITGEDPEKVPDSRFIITNQKSNDYRVRSITTQINDTKEHTFYVLGKNFIPNGKTIAEWFGENTVYSNFLEQVIKIGSDTYYVARMGIQHRFSSGDGEHEWRVESKHDATCLGKGKISYIDELTGEKQDVIIPPLGHVDENKDSICDRCQKKTDEGTPDRIHWNVGDIQARELDGVTYMFRCIDQNYSDGSENHRQTALFLADSIIPADYGSDYRLEVMEDGSHEYVFIPGPLVNFGSSNDYKYSNIRDWLVTHQDDFFHTEPVSIGVDHAFMGSTAEKEFSAFDSHSLRPYYIGNQQMKEHLFILSVDEAIKYKDFLWKFDGSEQENPDSQYSAFSKGYWLRNPMGDQNDHDTGYAYVVDIVSGNIHPALVKPVGNTGNDELDVTAVYGIRPAFTMPQD